MQRNQRVADMAREILVGPAGAHTKRAGETLEDALKAVLKTEAGRQFGKLRDGPQRDKLAALWQEDLALQRRKEREQDRRRQETVWEQFMQVELRELELRKEGQLAWLLDEALPGEPPAVL